jgi:hypothetical protein
MIPDTTGMTPVSALTGEEQVGLARRATNFLKGFSWCSGVRESYLAFDIGHPLGVFLFCIEPRIVGVDDTLWVVVGDVPPAFLVCDDAPDFKSALQCYVSEMQRWVEAVRAGGEFGDIIPVNVSPTQEHAEMLSGRLSFIRRHVLDGIPFPDARKA